MAKHLRRIDPGPVLSYKKWTTSRPKLVNSL
jgi:hypothetical protein